MTTRKTIYSGAVLLVIKSPVAGWPLVGLVMWAQHKARGKNEQDR